jgi:hypothetical protein
MNKEDENKKKDDVNQNLTLDFEKAFEIFSTKLNTDPRKSKRSDDNTTNPAILQ